MSEDGEKVGFLARWSRLKRAPEKEPAPELEPPKAASALEPPEPASCPIPGLPEIDLASLPKIEDLTASSDFSIFLKPGIPGALRAAALRKMWSVDPAIRDFINCVDYQWDFNTPGGLPFGFSAELGGDIKKLLAQAIGERDEEEEARLAAELEAKRAAEEAAQPLPEPEPEPEMLVAEAPEEVAAEPAPEPPPVPRRRHGGALPA